MNNKSVFLKLLILSFLGLGISACDPFSDLYYDNATGQFMNGKQFKQLHPDYHGD